MPRARSDRQPKNKKRKLNTSSPNNSSDNTDQILQDNEALQIQENKVQIQDMKKKYETLQESVQSLRTDFDRLESSSPTFGERLKSYINIDTKVEHTAPAGYIEPNLIKNVHQFLGRYGQDGVTVEQLCEDLRTEYYSDIILDIQECGLLVKKVNELLSTLLCHPRYPARFIITTINNRSVWYYYTLEAYDEIQKFRSLPPLPGPRPVASESSGQ